MPRQYLCPLDTLEVVSRVYVAETFCKEGVLSDFYYKYCSIKSTGLVNCTGFLLRVLVLDFSKVLTAKCTVSIKSTGLTDCTGF